MKKNEKKNLERIGNSVYCICTSMLDNGARYYDLNSMSILCDNISEVLKDGEMAEDLKEMSHRIYAQLKTIGFYDN